MQDGSPGQKPCRRPGWLRALLPTGVVLALTSAAGRAQAIDGVVEINHACATNGGCLAGDPQGYPVSISAQGSYRLTSNLIVPGGIGAANTDAILITASDVTLDLNGFAIWCRRNTIPFTPCTGSGTGRGITTNGQNVRIRNGTVRDFAGDGFQLLGSYGLEDVHSRNNGLSGVHALSNSSGEIARSSFAENDADGLRFDAGSNYVLQAIRSSRNGLSGLQAFGRSRGEITASGFHDNTGPGLSFAADSAALLLRIKTRGNSAAISSSSTDVDVGDSLFVEGGSSSGLGRLACFYLGATRLCP
jgi:hypothetical protein